MVMYSCILYNDLYKAKKNFFLTFIDFLRLTVFNVKLVKCFSHFSSHHMHGPIAGPVKDFESGNMRNVSLKIDRNIRTRNSAKFFLQHNFEV